MGLCAIAWRRVLPIAAGALALLLATANAYGYHRDELYFRVAGRHLQWGYPDQPPLTPLAGRLSEAIFGETPRGLRVVSAIAIALCVLLAALVARELGGGAAAQTVAAAGVASAAFALAVGHLLSTTTLDVFFWTVLCWLFVRLLRTGDRRLWLPLGLVTGIGLENKHLVLLLWASIAGGLVAARRLDVVRNLHAAAAVALACALWAPNLVWQARHDWPQLTLARQIADEDGGANRLTLLPLQLLLAGPLLFVVAVAGLRLLARDERLVPFRPLLWAYPALLALTLVASGKGYYTAGIFPLLLGVGGLAAERWLARGGRRRSVLLAAGIGVGLFSVLPFALPLVPVRHLEASPVAAVNEDAVETVGWPTFVRQVAAAYREAPGAVVLTGNYGEAGAIDRFGGALGLPRAYSGHNGFADWGIPPEGATSAVVVGIGDRGYLLRIFDEVSLAGRVDNGVGVDNEEQGGPIWICRGMRASWQAVWPELRHLSA